MITTSSMTHGKQEVGPIMQNFEYRNGFCKTDVTGKR